MARKPANSQFNSLKGKIRLTAGALAFFICTFGLISYLAVSFLTSDTFFAVFIPFLILAGAAVIFGWWLSVEVVRPIEKVSLLARSLERNALTSIPKTSGSTETDELLQVFHRNNQQMQTVVGLMERVAAGDLNVALAPLENSDRLIASFQKLLAKVSESIQAKKDLENLRGAINKLSDEVSPLQNGYLDVEIKSDDEQTREIAVTIRFLINQLNELIAQVKTDSLLSHNSATELKKSIRLIIETDENKIRQLNENVSRLGEIPNDIQKIAREFSDSILAEQSIEKARAGTQSSQRNLDSVGALRKQVQESTKRIGQLGEHSQEISNVAKSVADLARRTNLIALNASIQAAVPGGKNRGIAILAEEIERLAARAEAANKQISTLGKSISADIGAVEHSVKNAVGEAANLSKFAIETGNALGELEKNAAQFLSLQTKLVAYADEQAGETEIVVGNFTAAISQTEETVKNLKKSEIDAAQIADLTENLNAVVAGYKIFENEAEQQQPSGKKAKNAGDSEIVELTEPYTPKL